MPDPEESHRYVSDHFWPLERLAQAVGTPAPFLEAAFAHGCAPGVVYAYDKGQGWWSVLAARLGQADPQPPSNAEKWYAPAAVWGLRRAAFGHRGGATLSQMAEQLRNRFESQFEAALAMIPDAEVAFPHCYSSDGGLDPEATRQGAAAEWEDWVSGAYAVCLRIFTAETCVRKEALGAVLKRHLADPNKYPMPVADALDRCEALTQLMLPFAPWERPSGTPGVTIDRFLSLHEIGREMPYRKSTLSSEAMAHALQAADLPARALGK